MAKIQKGLAASKHGFAYLHVFSPCPTGWAYKPEKAIEVARKAVQCNVFPLWEMDHDGYHLNEIKKPITVAEFVKGILGNSRILQKSRSKVSSRQRMQDMHC